MKLGLLVHKMGFVQTEIAATVKIREKQEFYPLANGKERFGF